jgi:predicted NAD/FAD-binding protein
VAENLSWRTPKHRSEEYVKKISAILGDRVHLNKSIQSITRSSYSCEEDGDVEVITVSDEKGKESVFDKIVFACHPDQVLSTFLCLCCRVGVARLLLFASYSV